MDIARKAWPVVLLVGMLGLCASRSGAVTLRIGDTKLDCADLELDGQVVTARGNASLVSPEASIKAQTIRLDLARSKDGKLMVVKGTATGGVVVKAKQTDKKTKTTRDVNATAQTAVMEQGKDTVVLTGNVVVKVTDPGLAEPAVLTGENATVFLKDQKIRVLGSTAKRAEATLMPKEEEENSG